LDHGVISVDHARGRVVVARFDRGTSTPSWSETLAGSAARDATVAAWLSDAALVAIQHAADTQLVYLHLADGKSRPIASLPATEVVVAPSEKTGSFAAVFNERPECALCPRVEVR